MSPSDLLHQEGQFETQAPSFLWHSISTPEDLRAFVNSSPVMGVPQIKSTPMARRLQEILDGLDAAARSVRGEELSKIPKPKIYIAAQNELDAFAKGIGVCVKQKVIKGPAAAGSQKPRLSPPFSIFGLSFSSSPASSSAAPSTSSDSSASSRRADDQSKQIAAASKGIFFASPGKAIVEMDSLGGTAACQTMAEPAEIGWDPQAFVNQWNKKAIKLNESCELAYKDEAIVVPDDMSCGHFINEKQYNILQFPAQANIITVTSGIIKRFDEKAMTWILAHELGHYYRGHASAIITPDDFYFDQSSENELRHPAETKANQGLRVALDFVRMLKSVNQPQGVRIEVNLFPYSLILFNNFLIPYCELIAKSSSCQESKAAIELLFSGPDLSKHIAAASGQREMTDPDRTFIGDYEENFYKMLDEVQITKIPYDLALVLTSELPDGFDKLADLQVRPSSFRSWFNNFGKNVRANIPQIKPLYVDAMNLGLGFYTPEEEADEIGQELAARVGIELSDIEAALWGLFAYRNVATPVYEETELSYDACKSLALNDWRTADGQPVSNVLLGPLSDSHHSLCYRLFNIQREWKAHNFGKEDLLKTELVFDAKKWKQMLSDTNQYANALIGNSKPASASAPVEEPQVRELTAAISNSIGYGLSKHYESKLREVRARIRRPACGVFTDPFDLF